jgi:hypothetical protein
VASADPFQQKGPAIGATEVDALRQTELWNLSHFHGAIMHRWRRCDHLAGSAFCRSIPAQQSITHDPEVHRRLLSFFLGEILEIVIIALGRRNPSIST